MEQEQLSEIPIEVLPAEMLETLLKYLDVPSLFACRLVCRKWKVMCTPILHTRPETELYFDFSSDTVSFMKYEDEDLECYFVKQEGKHIQDFIDCVTQSGNFSSSSSPFVRFALINIRKWDKSISNFLSVVSPIATCLKLSFSPTVVTEATFIEKLRNLILHDTPCLKEFGLGFDQNTIHRTLTVHRTTQIPRRNSVKRPKVVKLALFSSRGKSSSSTKKPGPASILLPKLKVLQLGRDYDDDSTVRIFHDILRIAPNLKEIQSLVCDPLDSTICTVEDFVFFLDCGKLDKLKFVNFRPSSKWLSDWQNVIQKKKINFKEISTCFKIEDLQLSFEEKPNIKLVKSVWMIALQVLEQIFEGSKNTLKKLWMDETVEFPRGFSFPTFTKLSSVMFSADRHEREKLVASDSLFPAGCRLLNIFPNVKTLDLADFSSNLKHFFPDEDSTPVMPSVHTLTFDGVETKGEDVEILALLCPNLKKLEYKNGYFIENRVSTGKNAVEHFPSFGRAVWTNMKNLESLHLIIDADSKANAFPAIDSTFTGISKENCLRLFNESTDEDVQTLDADPEAKLRRESELKGLKVEESMLDIPKLKELKISLQSYIDYSLEDEDAAYKACTEKALTQLSRVTQLYAFKLMPGLKCEIIGGAYGG